MNLFDLQAKISLDSSEFDQGVENSKGKFGKLSAWTVAKGQVIANGIMAGAKALGGLAQKAIEAGSSFESQMSKVGAISGATGEDMEALNEKAKQLGIDTKFSATEAGQAFEYMAMAGWKTEDMLNGVSGVMDLAAASGESLGLVSDIVTDAMTAFGLSADQSTHFADVLAAASSNANTNVSMMGETFKYVAPVAGALGYNVEDTAVAIGLMANAGIKGSQAGTSLRSMMTNLAKPTDTVAAYIGDLGISLTDAAGEVIPLNQLLGDLRESFSGLTEAEKAEYAAGIAGQEGMSGLLAIVNASDADFQKLTDSIQGADGASKAMAATMADNLNGKLTLLQSSAEGLGIALYEGMQEPLKGTVDVAIESLNLITEHYKTDGVDGILEAVSIIFENLLGKVVENLPEMVKRGVELITKLAAGMVKAIPDLIKAIPQIVDAIIDGFKDADMDWIQIGKDLIMGVWEGIKSLGGWLYGKVSGFFEGLFKNTKEEEEIHSPSKKWARIGGYMAQGVGVGWEKEFASVRSGINGSMNFKTGRVAFADSGLGMTSAQIINSNGSSFAPAGPQTVELVLKSQEGQTFGRWMVPFIRSEDKSNPEVVSDPV